MSLLDDVSIVVTPNGYKAGTLFAVKPTIAYGSELVVNGDFSEGDTGWTIEAVWTISGGAAHGNGATGSSQELKQAILEVGKTYEFSYEIRNRVSGSVELLNSGLGSTFSNQVYTSIGIATSTELRFRPSSFNGDIYNVSVREFTGADMDVTRATAATRVDENGLVNYAEVVSDTELVTNGDFVTDTDWTLDSSTSIAGGLLTQNGTAGRAFQSITFLESAIGTYLKITFTVEAISSGSFQINCYGLLSPVVTTTGTYTFSGVTSNTTNLYVNNGGGFANGSISNISVKQSTVDNVPRIDYTVGVKGGCPHILAEPQRTNLITDSVDIDSYFTSQVDATFTNNYGTSPTGDSNSTRVQWADSTSFAYRTVSISTDTSASIFVKGTSGETVMFGFGANVTTGTVYTFDGSWQRITFTGSTGTTIFLSSYGGATATDFQAFGLQLEVGSYETSYIPTSGSTVTRNQDIFTRDGIGSLINSEEGVLFAELATLANDGTNGRISLSDGTTANRMLLYSAANSIKFYVGVSGESAFAFATTGVITDFNKVAISFKENDMKFYINGVLVYSNTSAATFLANSLNTLQLSDGNGQLNFNGKVKQLQVYKTALTDTQLAALTS